MKLRVNNCSMGYYNKTVLRDVTLDIDTGDIVCVLGRNGTGKTTLFKTLLGILPPISGDLFLNEKSIKAWDRRKFANCIAYIPQAHAMPFSYPVIEMVLMGRISHVNMFSSPSKKDIIIAEESLEKMNISHLRDRNFSTLSGGEQQLVITARALAQKASFIVMDEPTSSLDFGNQIKIIKQIRELREHSLGIIMATHSPDHVFMCDSKVILVDSGTAVMSGHCDKVITESMLNRLYDIDIIINQIKKPDNERKVCIPLL